MKIVSKTRLRRTIKYLLHEKVYFWNALQKKIRRPVREDSGSSFHDVNNDMTEEVMLDLTSDRQNRLRAGKGMIRRRLFVNAENQESMFRNKINSTMEYQVMGQQVQGQQQGHQVQGNATKGVIRLCIITTIVAVLFSGLTFAQLAPLNNSQDVTDTRLERYTTIVDILDESLAEFTSRPERSRERLQLASETFELIRQGSGTSGGLIQGLDNTFVRADTAITNQSIADFEIQTGLILGGLQRFLYETATREAQTGNLPLARAYIKRVIEDQSILEGEKIRLTNAVDAGALQAALEIALGQSIDGHLNMASESLAQEDQQGAYVALANAYSGFVTVQDSLSMPPVVAESLLTTIQDVVAQKPEAAQNVASLQENMATYIQFNESVLEQFNADLLGQAQTTDSAGAQATNAVAGQANSIQNAVAQEVAQQQGSAANLRDGLSTGINNTANALQAGSGLAEGLETVRTPLGAVGAGAVGSGAAGVLETGQAMVDSAANVAGTVNNAVDGLANGAVRGVTLGAPSLQGNNGQQAGDLGAPGSLGTQGSQGAALSLNRPAGSRTASNATLNGAANMTRNSNTVNMPVQPAVAEQSFWNGLPKAIVMLLLALASFIPLYLLQLAFGSGSSHWFWVRLAVFLLLFPLMLEGLASFGSVLADITGVSALGILEPFTVSGGPIGQMIWAATSLIAIGTLCFGLWGICKQFGLLGQDSASDDVVAGEDDLSMHTDAEFQTNPSAMTERFTLEEGPAGTVMDMGNETIIEWEDEF